MVAYVCVCVCVCVFEGHEAKQIKTSQFGAGPCKEMGASSSKQPQAPQKVLAQFSLVVQSCLTLCDPMDHSMPGLQAPAPEVYSNSCPLSR